MAMTNGRAGDGRTGGYLMVGVAEAPTEPLFGTLRPAVIDGARIYRRSEEA